jgi:hypothetical protein
MVICLQPSVFDWRAADEFDEKVGRVEAGLREHDGRPGLRIRSDRRSLE